MRHCTRTTRTILLVAQSCFRTGLRCVRHAASRQTPRPEEKEQGNLEMEASNQGTGDTSVARARKPGLAWRNKI